MFFRKCDMISPPITLFYKGDYAHSSIFSGILTIAIYILHFIFTVYYALEFIEKKNPTAYFFNRFIKDAGEYRLDSSSIFHYIFFVNKLSQSISTFDLDMVRIIGLEKVNIDIYYSSTDLTKEPHWIYGICNIERSRAEHLSNLIPADQKDKSVCITKYYNPNTKLYYDVTDKNNFKWPRISGGMSSTNFIFYGLIIEKCKNDVLRELSGLGPCKDSVQINDYIYSNAVVMEFIDHYPDVLNYKEPFTKYFYSISNLLYQKSFTVNNINLNPAIIKTHNGIFFDNVVEQRSYLFDQNEKVIWDEQFEVKDEFGNPVNDEDGNKIYESTGIVSGFYFWMQNRLQYYERNYKRLQDVLSNIGGLSRTVFFISIFINLIIAKYITFLDTEELVICLDKNFKKEKNIQKPITIYELNKPNMFPPKKINFSNENYLHQCSNFQGLSKESDKFQNYDEFLTDKIESNKSINNKTYNLNEEYKFSNNKIQNLNSIGQIQTETFKKKKIKKKRSKFRIQNIKKMLEKNEINTLDIKNEEKEEKEVKEVKEEKEENYKTIKNQNYNLFKYFLFKICCEKNNQNILFYENYRKKMLSEESIVQGNLELSKVLNYLKLKETKEN